MIKMNIPRMLYVDVVTHVVFSCIRQEVGLVSYSSPS